MIHEPVLISDHDTIIVIIDVHSGVRLRSGARQYRPPHSADILVAAFHGAMVRDRPIRPYVRARHEPRDGRLRTLARRRGRGGEQRNAGQPPIHVARARQDDAPHGTIAGVVFLDLLFRLQYSGDGPRRPMGFGGQPLAALSVDTRAHAVAARSRVGAYSVAGQRPRLRDAESHICRTVAAIAGRTDRYGCDAGRPWCGTTCRGAALSRPDPRVRTLWS